MNLIEFSQEMHNKEVYDIAYQNTVIKDPLSFAYLKKKIAAFSGLINQEQTFFTNTCFFETKFIFLFLTVNICKVVRKLD